MKLINTITLIVITSIQSLAAKDTLILESGEQVHGFLQGMEGGYVSLSNKAEDWEHTRRFSPESIKRFIFDDKEIAETTKHSLENKNYDEALAPLEFATTKRLPYLEFLPKEDEFLFVAFIQCLAAAGKQQKAIDIIKIWKSRIDEEDHQKTLEFLNLHLTWKLAKLTEANLIAEELIENGYNAHTNPTPWAVLAHSEFQNSKFEKALWLSLQPISFGAVDEAQHLNTCYALAILCAKQVEDTKLAQCLEEEMNDRRLSWPPNFSQEIQNKMVRNTFIAPIDPTSKPSKTSSLSHVYRTLGQP